MKNPEVWEGKRKNHNSAKLTERDVYLIKGLLKEGLSAKDIAEKFEVTRNMIWRIRNGTNWTHVPEYGEAHDS